MSEIQNNNKLVTVSYLAKVLTPVVTLVKSVQTKVMEIFSLPKGGTAGQVLAKTSDVDGEAEWVDLSASGALDDAPTLDSENAVKSGGVYTALEDKQDKLTGAQGQVVGFDADGNAVAQDAAAAALPVGTEGQYIGYDADGNAIAADMDAAVTEDSAAAVTSGAVYTALADKQDLLVGTEGQLVSFDADGKAVAVDAPADHLTREVVDALPVPADAVETVIYVLKVTDADTAAVTYEEYQLVEGALVRMSGEPVDLSGYQEKLAGTETQYVGFDADGKAVAIDLPEGHLTREVIDTMVTADVAEENVEYILKVVDAVDPTIVKYQHWALIDGEMVMIGGKDIELPEDHLAYEVVDVLPDAADAVEGKVYILRITDANSGAVSYQEYKLLDGAMVLTNADLSNVQTRLTGLENQYVGFDANGDAVAVDLPTGYLVREVVDALPLADDASEDVIYILKVVDPDDATVTYEQWQLIEGAFAQVGGAPVELPENHLTREVVDALPAAADALETVMYVLRVVDADTGAVSYTEHQLIDGEMVQTSADLSGYQTKLTGTAGQMIVIDANGDAVAQDFPEGMLTREVVDVLPDVADAKENVTYILKNDDGAGNITYSEWQLIDGELVQVGGEATDMSAYQLKLTGTETQYVGFDATGKAVAVDLPTGHLTREVVDALPAEADASGEVVYILKVTDADTAAVSYQEWVLVEGAFVQTSGAAVDLSGKQDVLVGLEGQHVVFDADGKAVAADMPAAAVLDAVPTEGSTNGIESGAVYAALQGKMDAVTGVAGQVIGFDADGKPVAQDAADNATYEPVVGVVTTLEPGEPAAVVITNDPDAQTSTFDFSIPRGEDGAAYEPVVGTVTMVAPDDVAVTVTNDPDAMTSTFDFAIPAYGNEVYEPVVGTVEVVNTAAETAVEIVNDADAMQSTFNFKIPAAAAGAVYEPEIGTVTTLGKDEEATASVTLDMDTMKATYDFGIPCGADGAPYTPAVGTVTTVDDAADVAVTVTLDPDTMTATYDFALLRGENSTMYTPEIGVVNTVEADQPASVTVTVDAINDKAVYDFDIPKGEKGEAYDIVIGTVNHVDYTEPAAATVDLDPDNMVATLNLDIPQGEPSAAYKPIMGTTTTLEPGEEATVTMTPDDAAQTVTYDYAIPRGADGKTYEPVLGTVEVVETADEAAVEIINDDTALTSTFSFKLPKGDAGMDGAGFEPAIGTVNTVEADQPANVTMTLDQDTKVATFDFDIPKGADGEGAGDLIDDTATGADKTWSAVKIAQEIANGAGGGTVSYAATQTSGNALGTLTIDGTDYIIYSPTNYLRFSTSAPSSPVAGDAWLVV